MLNKSYIILYIEDSFIKSILRLLKFFYLRVGRKLWYQIFGFMNFFSYYVKPLRLYMIWALKCNIAEHNNDRYIIKL